MISPPVIIATAGYASTVVIAIYGVVAALLTLSLGSFVGLPYVSWGAVSDTVHAGIVAPTSGLIGAIRDDFALVAGVEYEVAHNYFYPGPKSNPRR